MRKQEITRATPFILCSRKDLPTPLHPAPLHTKSCALGLLSFNRKLNFTGALELCMSDLAQGKDRATARVLMSVTEVTKRTSPRTVMVQPPEDPR